jgi:formylglycine-generating enzyme
MRYFLFAVCVVIIAGLFVACSTDSPTDSDKDKINPTCSIISPVNNSVFTSGENVRLEAEASDNKLVIKVEFLIDGEVIKSFKSTPYEYEWDTSGLSGNFLFSSKAYDSDNNIGVSETVNIIVNTLSDSIPPVIEISSPADDSIFTEGSIVTIKALASDSNGILKVEFFIDDSLYFSDNTHPYEFNWDTTGRIGSHSIISKAFDNAGNSSTSEPVTVNVNEGSDTSPPNVTLTSPADNSEFVDGSEILIQAQASDNVGVLKVVFWIDGVAVYADLTSPYEYLWKADGAIGSHSIIADAYDAGNNYGTSQSITINIKRQPYFEIKNPVSGNSYEMGTQLQIMWESNVTGNVDIYLLQENSIHLQIADSVTNIMSYMWSIPVDLEASDKYTIRVSSSLDTSVYGDSNPYFKLSEAYITGSMSFIEGGTFQMGDKFSEGETYELPLHDVFLSDYMIAKYETTQPEWEKYMTISSTIYGSGDRYPVYAVSWYEVIKYCNLRSLDEDLIPCYTIKGSTDPSLWGTLPNEFDSDWNNVICDWNASGYRLPTEAEWEYAAKGGKFSIDNHRYSGSNDPDKVAWSIENSDQTNNVCSKVGKKQCNQLGLYDMSGNVNEYCWDWFKYSYYQYCFDQGTVTNPTGPEIGDSIYKIFRGGDWKNSYLYVRSSCRNGLVPYPQAALIGFRVVKKP